MFPRIEIGRMYLEVGHTRDTDTTAAPPVDTPYPLVEDHTWPDDQTVGFHLPSADHGR